MNIETSQECGALFKALAAFQGAVGAPKKNANNPHFKSKFADLAEVLETAKRPMADNGLALVQLPCGECDGTVRVVTMLTHESGQWMRATVSMPVAQKTPQAVGSAITYARRYCAMAALGMAADDDDGESAEGRGKGKPVPQRRTIDQLAAEGERERPFDGQATSGATSANGSAAEPVIDTFQANDLAVQFNEGLKATCEFAGLSETGEVDKWGLMVPPGDEPVFQSGADEGRPYGAVPAGKLRALIASKKFREGASPQTQLWANYLVARHEVSKLLGGAP